MLTCRDLTEDASAYLDGETPPVRALRLRLHLMMCGNCRRYLAQMRQSFDLVRARYAEAMPEPAPHPAEDDLVAAFKARFPS